FRLFSRTFPRFELFVASLCALVQASRAVVLAGFPLGPLLGRHPGRVPVPSTAHLPPRLQGYAGSRGSMPLSAGSGRASLRPIRVRQRLSGAPSSTPPTGASAPSAPPSAGG